MEYRYLVLAAVLASIPAAAEEVQFEGHAIEVDASQEARNILRMTGTRYGVRGSAAQIIDKARQCIGSGRGFTLESTDPANGKLSANGRFDYRQLWSTHSVRARLTIEADDGHFRLVQSELGHAQGSGAETPDAGYSPISQENDDWREALAATIEAETRLVDCMYR